MTGSFAIIPLALLERRTTVAKTLKNFGVVIVGKLLVSAAEAKTLGYETLGASGIALVVIKAILCNWMVALGAIAALTSTSTDQRAIADCHDMGGRRTPISRPARC